MKKILSLIAALLMIQSLHAQQEPLFAQYMNNSFLINPAVAGSRGTHGINLFHRWQWVSFPGAPQTFGLSYQGLIKDVHGVGALIFSDITGPSVRIGAKTSYAFHIPINDDMRLSIGAAARVVRNSINTRTINFLQDNDAAVANASEAVWGGDAEFGLYFYSRDYYVGFQLQILFKLKLTSEQIQQLAIPLEKDTDTISLLVAINSEFLKRK